MNFNSLLIARHFLIGKILLLTFIRSLEKLSIIEYLPLKSSNRIYQRNVSSQLHKAIGGRCWEVDLSSGGSNFLTFDLRNISFFWFVI